MFIPTWILIVAVVINVGVISFFIWDWFKKNYTIVDLETWNTIATFYNENQDEGELPGGTGFFRECIYEDVDDEDEEEYDE